MQPRHRIDQDNPQLPYVDVVHGTRPEEPPPKTYEDELVQRALANQDNMLFHPEAIRCAALTVFQGKHAHRLNAVHRHLALYMSPEGYAAPVQERIVRETGLSLSSVQRSLDDMEDWGILVKINVGSGDRKRNVYRHSRADLQWRPLVGDEVPSEESREALRRQIRERDQRILDLETQLAAILGDSAVTEEEEGQCQDDSSSSSSVRTSQGDSVTVTLSDPPEDTEAEAEVTAWVEANWSKTGWRSPEAAIVAYQRDPVKFAKERRAYEAGWRAAERKRQGTATMSADEKPCRSCGEIVSKYLVNRNGECRRCTGQELGNDS